MSYQRASCNPSLYSQSNVMSCQLSSQSLILPFYPPSQISLSPHWRRLPAFDQIISRQHIYSLPVHCRLAAAAATGGLLAAGWRLDGRTVTVGGTGLIEKRRASCIAILHSITAAQFSFNSFQNVRCQVTTDGFTV